jgi:asparaginyl-tRNA synthetase
VQQKHDVIATGLGRFSKDKFNALLNVRAAALSAIRDILTNECGYTEVSTASLVNIAGSCENPHASFTLNYYGHEAHLSQSAQLQLEALVIRLNRRVFTVNNSFREENYDDPEAEGRRLSEFTLIEPERPYDRGESSDQILNIIMYTECKVLSLAISRVLENCKEDIVLLGGDIDYLKSVLGAPLFKKITYDQALEILNKAGGNYQFGDDFGVAEERKILEHFNNIPTFVTHYPATLKFFNMKRTPDGKRCYSVDLLMPRLGETSGGAVREEDGEKIKQYLLASKIADYAKSRGLDPLEPFREYFNLFEQENPTPRGGFGIGFERFIGFLIQSNDILDTLTYEPLKSK